ncbi:MAG: ATP-dependent Clp protease adaptor ClpS [Chloroflexota bacterium]|nr:ATP-dependent Clp protease adaptor ClpS [Chloroflexota bacterium]
MPHRILAQRSAPETVSRPEIGHAESAEPEKRYHLILLDDDDHSYAYVVEMLGRLFGYGREKAFAIAAMVDTQGRAIVETNSYDRVRHDQQRIHDYGPDPRIERCLGSMSAVIEEAP